MVALRGAILAAILAAGQGTALAEDLARDVLEEQAYQKDLPPGQAVPARPSATPSASPGDDAHDVLGDDGYQKDLPSRSPPEPDFSPPQEFGLLRFLLQASIVVAAALAVVWLARTFLARRERDVALPAEATLAPLDVEMQGPERLAATGRWDEAIHALLLETLAALSRAAQLPASYTSREILQRVRLPPRALEALEGLVLAVEVSRFGGIPAGAADYRICLDRFHAFLETYRRPAREAA